MKYTLKTLSLLFSYPGHELRELAGQAENLRDLLSSEDEEIAGLIYAFLKKLDLDKADELYVSVFEMPVKCALYAHYYTLKDKQSEVGSYLLEIKARYKSKGFDIPVSKELPDFLPVMLEFLSSIIDQDPQAAARFARKYIQPWLAKLKACIEKNRPEYAPLARALELAINKVVEFKVEKT